jgi:hypothetical protein
VNRRWTFYILLIYTGLILLLMIFTIPETHHPTLLTVKAKQLRHATSNPEYHSPAELLRKQTTLTTALANSLRTPFQLLFLEPMCGLLCVYSALVLGILYLFFGAFEMSRPQNPLQNSVSPRSSNYCLRLPSLG